MGCATNQAVEVTQGAARLWCAFTAHSMAIAYASSLEPKPKVSHGNEILGGASLTVSAGPSVTQADSKERTSGIANLYNRTVINPMMPDEFGTRCDQDIGAERSTRLPYSYAPPKLMFR